MNGHSTFLWIFLLLEAVTGLEAGENCSNHDGNSGSCVLLKECPPFFEALNTNPIPPETLEFVRKSLCGVQKRHPLVCCPSTTQPTPPWTTEPAPSPTTPTSSPTDTEVTEDVTTHINLHLLPLNLCGPIGEERVIKGNKTALNEMPWMALLAYNVRFGSPYKCGGTVINNRYVLTAAHCVKFLPINFRVTSVRLGEHDLASEIDCMDDPDEDSEKSVCAPKPQDIRIEEVIPHPMYTGAPNLQYDIALLRLSTEVDFTTDSVRPICLPIGLDQQEQDLLGKKLVVTGWGLTENSIISKVLLKVKVPVVEIEKCETLYKNKALISKKNQLCAGGDKNGGDSCKGDSGGPLMWYGRVEGSLRTIEHGIVSFGLSCGSPEIPAVYTRVGFLMKWILDNIRP